jgi:hypothetical protein
VIPVPNNSWPQPFTSRLADCDEWGNEEWLYHKSNWENYLEFAPNPTMTELEYHTVDRDFMELYLATLRGEIKWDDPKICELQHRLGLVRDPHHDRRRYDLPQSHVEEIIFWEMVENFVPDTAPMAIDRILGQWGDLPTEIGLQRAAVTALSFTYNLEDRGRAFKRYLRDDDKPSVETRQTIKMVEHTPAMLWKIKEHGWEPMLPIFEYWIPNGKIEGCVTPITSNIESNFVVARVAPSKDGWRAYGAIGFETAPDTTPLMRRLNFALTRLRRHERRATWEDLLRDRCELIYRYLANYAWLDYTTTIRNELERN